MTTIQAAMPRMGSWPQTLPSAAAALQQPTLAQPTASRDAGTASGGGGFKLFGINIGKMAAFAAIGAAAAMYIPPLMFLGGPIGGAIAGAALSLIL